MEGIVEGLTLILKEYGFYAAVVAYFLGRDAWREWRMAKSHEALQSKIDTIVFPLVKSSTEALTKSAAVVEQNTEAFQENQRTLEDVRILLNRAIQAT